MDEITYQEIINKLNGLSEKVFALARMMDRFSKRNADAGNPMPVLEIAKDFLTHTSYTIDTIADKMEGERELVQEYLADCGQDECQ